MELFICVQNGDVLDRILENANSFSFIITWKLRLRVAQFVSVNLDRSASYCVIFSLVLIVGMDI